MSVICGTGWGHRRSHEFVLGEALLRHDVSKFAVECRERGKGRGSSEGGASPLPTMGNSVSSSPSGTRGGTRPQMHFESRKRVLRSQMSFSPSFSILFWCFGSLPVLDSWGLLPLVVPPPPPWATPMSTQWHYQFPHNWLCSERIFATFCYCTVTCMLFYRLSACVVVPLLVCHYRPTCAVIRITRSIE